LASRSDDVPTSSPDKMSGLSSCKGLAIVFMPGEENAFDR
jgi:hypothetical protein